MVNPFKRKRLLQSDRAYWRQIIVALETISQQLADKNKIEEIKKVSLKKGDCIIIRYKGALTEVAFKNIKSPFEKLFQEYFGFRIPIIILEEGMYLEVLSKE